MCIPKQQQMHFVNAFSICVQLINDFTVYSVNPKQSLDVTEREKGLSKQQANSFMVGVCPEKYSQASVDKRA